MAHAQLICSTSIKYHKQAPISNVFEKQKKSMYTLVLRIILHEKHKLTVGQDPAQAEELICCPGHSKEATIPTNKL